MRRAVVAVIMGGYAFWAIGSGLGHQPAIVGARLTAAVKPAKPAGAAQPARAAEPAKATKTAGPATQTVTFGGYTVSVPASWPVYDRVALHDLGGVAGGQPVQAVRRQPRGQGGRDLPEHRRRLGGQRGRAEVTGGHRSAPAVFNSR